MNQLQATIDELLSDKKDPTKLEVRGLRVLLRLDLNVPLSKGKDGRLRVADDNRVVAALPTVKLLAGADILCLHDCFSSMTLLKCVSWSGYTGSEKGARVILASHLGRPIGDGSPEDRDDFSLAPVRDVLASLLPHCFVGMASDCVGEEVESKICELTDGSVLLLENTRFHPGDAKNDDGMARQLARLADVFVNDAFGVVHRSQASVTVRTIRPAAVRM